MNILTFDIEEWFHILDNDSTKTVDKWGNYEVRIHRNMDRIFNVLEKTNTKATFFCIGWIAEKYPEVIREIIHRGFEIGSHTRMHQLVYDQTKLEFSNDVEHSIKTLEDISGTKVKYFRAPGFSITENETWAFEVLLKNGIEVDCSIFPSSHGHGGFPSYPKALPSLINYRGQLIKELPINSKSLYGKSIIFSGGGYFRLIPYWFINKWINETDYVMTYLHPRDFDTEQPVIKELSSFRKFKSYYGLQGSIKKLERLLNDFDFIDINTAVKTLNWDEVPVVTLK